MADAGTFGKSLVTRSVRYAGGLDDLLLVLRGLKNKKNQIKVKCEKCGVEMVRTLVGRRHDQIDIYAPRGEERRELDLREL